MMSSCRVNEGENEYDGGRMSAEQKSCLLDFMMDHPDFSKGQFIGVEGRKTLQSLWEVLSCQLNSLEGPKKSVAKWKRTWIQLKNKVKRKASGIKNYRGGTGGGPPPIPLTDLEAKIVEIMSPEAVYGIETDALLDSEEIAPLEESTSAVSVVQYSTVPPSVSSKRKRKSAEPLPSISQSQIDHDYIVVNEEFEKAESVDNLAAEMVSDTEMSSASSSSRSTPECTPRKRRKHTTRDAVEKFLDNEEIFNDKLDKMLNQMEENNKINKKMLHEMKSSDDIRKQVLEERKTTNKLLNVLINTFKK